jgi:hypothetical protein
MKHFGFWQRWLLVSGLIFLLMGLAFVAISLLGVDLGYINAAFWETEEIPAGVKPFQTWIYGVYIAMALAFGLCIIFLASNAFSRREKGSWSCLAIGFLTWFVFDTFFSVRAGVYINAFNNTLLFVLMILPLLFTRKAFVSRKDLARIDLRHAGELSGKGG